MKILYVADGRSPIALNWIKHFVDAGHEVHLVSSFPCAPQLNYESLTIIPIAATRGPGDPLQPGVKHRMMKKLFPVNIRTALRQRLAPYTLPNASRQLKVSINKITPDLVHAMRIPFEGMLTALAEPEPPLLISVWGNDFTLHAPSTNQLGRLTRLTLQRCDALHTDCQRDLQLAQIWGYPDSGKHIVLPGAGGIKMDLFYPPEENGKYEQNSPDSVINPRGIRAYIRNDSFFRAIPLVLSQRPSTQFICPAMEQEKQAIEWVENLNISRNVKLLPHQTPTKMADLFRKSKVAVSPSTHDGTPNTLLEAMACGCLPIAGDIQSLREWITPGMNGLLVDPSDPQAIAEAILIGLESPELRTRARDINQRLVAERAEYQHVMASAEDFYRRIIELGN